MKNTKSTDANYMYGIALGVYGMGLIALSLFPAAVAITVAEITYDATLKGYGFYKRVMDEVKRNV